MRFLNTCFNFMYIYNIIYSLKAVACFLSSRTDLLYSPRITAGKALSLVMHLVSYRGRWKHRLKQKFIFSLVQWKRSLTPREKYKPCTIIPVFYLTRCEDWTAIEDSSQESFQARNIYICCFQGSQLPILHKGCSYG